MNQIRNFCIIAHIDHGKSTLADRLLEMTGTVEKRAMKQQLLDKMDLEREKGITIKLAPVRMRYTPIPKIQDPRSQVEYQLNLIDTPGHVDFSYEVSRSLQACEGALLIVDASQGIQAQTLANVYLAIEANLEIIPVLNKIDLPAADVQRVSAEVKTLLGCKDEDILKVSAKTGEGVDSVLQAIVERVPAPDTKQSDETRALIFDSYYDDYRGVILYLRVFEGSLPKGSEIKMLATAADGLALEVGHLSPNLVADPKLDTGEIGYVVTNLKTTAQAKVGDTVTLRKKPASQALPGYKEVTPFVFAGIFPSSNDQYAQLKDAIEKLTLSDSALVYEPENSPVLGHGFRVGFLGLLHMDIVKERLEREYDLELITSNPSTDYHVLLTSGEELDIRSASALPDAQSIAEIREPWVNGEVVCPSEYVGAVIQLVASARGIQKNIDYLDTKLAVVNFEAPLANLLTDFYDKLKSQTSGYGSFNYELSGYRAEDLVRVDFYVAGDIVEALSIVRHRSEAVTIGRDIVAKLKDIIPRQQFKVALQAGIGGKFIAREDLSGFRKDVTAKLYGGDVSRRKKLLEKQKKGKERMKRFGKVDIPSEAFTVLLQRNE
ncbi:translation elongation factor 4 [Candidatus Saccharibacteria bacterium]|nr:translation elongation factor 4 [Candidatus Saccharibacteria bacterium]MCB9821017.1 elongation factor 4 [Candidatus Nomurabacteria bacterium]